MNNSSHFKVLASGFAGMLFFGAAFITMGTVLPSLTAKFNLLTADASILTGLLPIGILAGSLLFGPIVDRFGYKVLLIVSTLVTILGLELMVFADNIELVRIAILIMGTGGGVMNGETNALVSEVSDDKNRSTNLSILGIFYCLGAILLPMLFKLLPSEITYVHIVSGISALMFISVIYHLTVKFPQPKVKQGFPLAKAAKMASDSTLLLLSFALFFQSALEGISQSWLPIYLAQEKGMLSADAMTALSVMVAGILAGRIVLSIILERISNMSVLAAGMGLSALGITLFSVFGTFASALAGAFLLGFGFAATFPIVLGQVGNKFKELSATAFSFALVVALIGNTLLNLLIGVFGLASFPIIAVVSTFFILSLYVINHLKDKKHIK
jgi:fucose permease